jgi:hypothetical protein
VSRGAALTGALLITLATPATWPIALAAFLVRGGLLLVLLPIVALPSPVGLGNLLAPTLTTIVFRGVSPGVAALIGLIVVVGLAWIVAGGLVAAALDAAMARMVARDEDVAGEPRQAIARSLAPGGGRVAARILAARLVAHAPTGLALIWGSARLVAITYGELTSPSDVATPIALRVVRGAPDVISVVAVAWMLGEIVGGIAARRIALDGAGVRRALRDAVGALARHPLAVLVGFWVPTAGLVVLALPSALAAAAAWTTVRVAMRPPADPFGATFAVLLFVALWLVGLVLIAVVVAWRGAVWSVAHRGLWAQATGSGSEPG